jgi:hypothetical protein
MENWGNRAIGVSLAVVTAGWFFHLWLFSDAAWLHPEMLGSSFYIWIHPDTDTFWTQIRRMFDWKAFDPNVNRVRPINDVFETIDAITRPHLTRLFGSEASLLPSVILTVICVPSLLFGWLRRVTRAWLPALILTLVLVASTAFLSVTVASLHPAKRINMILLCGTLYLAQRHADEGRGFWGMMACLLAGFFADELGLAAFPIVAIIYWRSIMAERRKLIAFLLLPAVFLVLTKWGLPAFYLRFSVHGAWDALADSKKLAVFGYLLNPDFYVAFVRQTARSILSTVGIGTHVPATEIAVLAVVGGVTAWRVRSWADPLLLALLALLGASLYATLLDWYPFPNEISYMGSFNFYYHSPIAVLVIGWLAFAWRSVSPLMSRPWQLVGVCTATAVIVANFVVFERVNRLVSIIHMLPYSNAEIFRALRAGPAATVEMRPDASAELVVFEATLKKVFGARWQDNGYYVTYKMLAPRPLMGETQIKLLFYAYYPKLTVEHVTSR